MIDKVKLNRYGFYELTDKPSYEELEEYYKRKYYQEPKGSYEKDYSKEELLYIKNKLQQKYEIIKKIIKIDGELMFLDIGCGEGWSLKFFKQKNWKVTGIDFSTYGCKKFNYEVIDNVIEGDIYVNIDRLIADNKKFNCIYMINVLEHVLDPLMLLKKCYKLLSNNGVILIQVPNDFSLIQQYLIDNNIIDNTFWVSIPDHISYFNKEGLTNICNEAGFIVKKIISDFPIDFNLFNDNTNYVKDKTKGKNCYKTKICIENLLHSLSVDKVNQLYECLADLGIGRNLGFFLVKTKIN